jgi:hypothetical protein
MAQQRTVRREVETETQTDEVAPVAETTEQTVTRKTERKEVVEAVPATTVAPARRSTNVNVSSSETAGGNVSVNTPDGTQVNVNG